MNSNRVFLALAAGLLTVPERHLHESWAKAGEFCKLDAVNLEAGVGAAIGGGGNSRIALRQWIEKRRAEGVIAVFAAVRQMQGRPAVCHEDDADFEDDNEDQDEDEDYCEDGDDQRPAHMMAGFAGGMPMLLGLRTHRASDLYAQGTVSGPRLLLSRQLFVRLVQEQDSPAFHWSTVLSELNQFRVCNGRAEIASSDLIEHLASPEAEREWEFMAEQIFREVQVEALTFDEPFVIPPEFAHLVKRVTPFLDRFEPCIWLEACDADPSGPQLLQLIEAQGFGDRIWQIVGNRQLVQGTLQDDYDLTKFPDIAPAEWPDYLARMSDEESWEIGQELVELVRLECERTGTQPCIPDNLKEVFGPDDEERRRLYFRQRLQHDLGWGIGVTRAPWMLYVLDRIDAVMPVDARRELSQSRQEFIAALHAIRDFALHVESPFAATFEFALHLAAHAGGQGSPDLAAMRRSDANRSPEWWESAEQIVGLFSPFGWGADRLLGLAAISSADVFGAMGSWNDQGFDGDDDVIFRAVSKRLFAALNRYYESIVSFETGEQDCR